MEAIRCDHCGGRASTLPPKPPDIGPDWDLNWESDGTVWKALHFGTTVRVSRSFSNGMDFYCAIEREIGRYPHVVRLGSERHIHTDALPAWLRWAMEAVADATLGDGVTA